MNLSRILPQAQKAIKQNLPQILSAGAVIGVGVTGVLSARAGMRAGDIIDDRIQAGEYAGLDRREVFVLSAKLTWRRYIPAVAVGVATSAAIVGSSKVSMNRTVVAAAAYSATERAFTEYKEKVVGELGKGAEEKIRHELAQEKVAKTSTSTEIVLLGDGPAMCCELWTMRYFRSDVETIKRIVKEINKILEQDKLVYLDEFYDKLGLDYTAQSNKVGWTSDRPMNIVISAVVGPRGEPTLAFDYNYLKPL